MELYAPGSMVLVTEHSLKDLIGVMVEIEFGRVDFLPPEPWYAVHESNGKRHAAAHSWLKPIDWKELQSILGYANKPALGAAQPREIEHFMHITPLYALSMHLRPPRPG